jgi:hypothetical protein
MLIYGIECEIPKKPSIIDGSKLPKKNQKFRHVIVPESFSEIEFDSDGKPIYSKDQWEFISKEFERCNNGYWFMNNGTPIYITGMYYYYLNYWTLENGNRPEYRDSDRKFFIFFEECYNDPYILGIIRGKKRREGATSQGSCISTKIATFEENQRCGTISKTGKDAEDLFQSMIVYGFFALPIFFQPRTDSSTNPKTKLLFIEPAKKGAGAKSNKTTLKREGLNSFIDFRNTKLNSYDSGRFSFILIDEGGKWEEIDISKYLMIVQQVVMQGASKVGFLYMPTTVNPPNQGGDRFKKMWDNSNQFKHGKETPNRMVRYFQPAEEGLAGFIDEYGYSVVDNPTAEQLAFLKKKQEEVPKRERIPDKELEKGAKQYLLDQLLRLTDSDDISEFKRMYPSKEDDMFSFGDSISPFSLERIESQERWLLDNPTPLRKVKLLWNDRDRKVEWIDDASGKWLIYKLPKRENAFTINNYNVCSPLMSHEYGAGVDPFRTNKTSEKGSNGSICIGTKLDTTKEESEEGGEVVAMYLGRPPTKEEFWKECLLASLFYGVSVTIERDAGDSYYEYFQKYNFLGANCLPMLGKKPDFAIDPERKKGRNELLYGVNSADPYAFAKQIDAGQIYVMKYCWKIMFPVLLDELKRFDVSDRTKFDTTISFLIMLLAIMGESKQRKIEQRKEPLVQTYKVRTGRF